VHVVSGGGADVLLDVTDLRQQPGGQRRGDDTEQRDAGQ